MADEPDQPPSRRSFLGAATCAVGGGLLLSAAGLATGYVLGPVGRRTVVTANGTIDVGSIESLVIGARPVRRSVVAATVRDGWAATAAVPLGAAWLQRLPSDKIVALSSVCPHLACAIGWDEPSERFICPCHDSSFAPTGIRIAGPAPRDMDPLPVVVEKGRLKLRWLRYRQGVGSHEVL